MTSQPDNQLLAEFHAKRSEEAFGALVRQHISLVYGTALRQVGDPAAAEEIAQNVFIALAQSAGKLGSHPTIAGWLHRTTLNKSREWLRAELRRRRREQTSLALAEAKAEGDSVWAPLVPLLDEALLQLRDPDRAAVILHFIEGRTFDEVGATLGIGEDAARKRVDRCLDQLTKFFHRRGFAVPALSAAVPLFALALHPAPAGLASSVTTAAIANHSSAIFTLKGAIKIMALTQAKTAIVAGVAVMLAAGTTIITVKEVRDHSTSYHGRSLEQWLVDLDDQKPGPAFDRAEEAVRYIGKNGVPIIVAKLKAKGPVDHRVIIACYELGPYAEPAIPELIRLLNRGYARGYIAAALGRIGVDAIPPLITSLTNRNIEVRAEAASALGGFRNDDPRVLAAIPALVRCLGDDSAFVRAMAGRSLGNIRRQETTVVPALMKCLEDTDRQVQWAACLALGDFGTNAAPAVPVLLSKFNASTRDVHAAAALALIRIEPNSQTRLDALMPVLIENINGFGGRGNNFRFPTIMALADHGQGAKQAVPAILDAIHATSGPEQFAMLEALKKIDPIAAATNASVAPIR